MQQPTSQAYLCEVKFNSMSTKTISHVYQGTAPYFVGDGFRVSNYIPGVNNYAGNELSPFILLDYNEPHKFAPSQKKRGVGEHPHRGFETVSISYQGEVEHRDSTGAGGIIRDGEVQWMTAAGGLMHEEFQSENFARNGGVQHFIQLWVNLPAKHKMDKPHYQAITRDMISEFSIDNNGSVARIIAGDFKGVKGAAKTYTPIEMYDLRLTKGSQISFDVPLQHNAMLLVTKGSITVSASEKLGHKDFAVFNNDGETIDILASEDSMIFFISGEPINESIARYGPFVMNTKAEIIQAMEDVNSGKFGVIS